MKLPENCPVRSRVVQGDAYSDAGMEDFAFQMYRPFTAEDFNEVAAKYEISSSGLANAANQLLAENMGNNLAQKVRTVLKNNTSLDEGEEPQSLPDQTDLDAMFAAYDFSGVRTSSGGGVSASPMEKALYHYARQIVRGILRENGYAKLELSAPVTVAKKGDAPKDNQISYDVYEEEVAMLAEGEGAWGEDENYVAFRNEYVVEPAEAKVAADEKATVDVSSALGLFK
jgi:hypothetical protein